MVQIELTPDELGTLGEALDQASARYEEIIEDGCQDNVPGDGSGAQHEEALKHSLHCFELLGRRIAGAQVRGEWS